MKISMKRGAAAAVVIAVAAQAAGQSTTRASVDSAGGQGNAVSSGPSISADGRYVAFVSYAYNLVPGDTNALWDVFVRDRVSGTTTRASVSSSGAQTELFDCSYAVISADGRYVAFDTVAGNLVPGDTNVKSDVFVHDLSTGVTTRASVGSAGGEGNGDSRRPSISADGRYVAFGSLATNLVAGDTNGVEDSFVRDLQLGVTTRASVATGGAQLAQGGVTPSLSADGRYVAFSSGFGDSLRIRDLQSGTTTLVVLCTTGFPPSCHGPTLSADGRYLAYSTYGPHVAGDTNDSSDVFVRDLQTEVTFRASVDSWGRQGNDSSAESALSPDGRYVVFTSSATNLVPYTPPMWGGTYLRDLANGVTTRMDVDSAGVPPNSGPGSSQGSGPSVSGDGGLVVFYSGASNLVGGDTNAATDVFVRDWREPAIVLTCPGDGSGAPCPCGNSGLPGHGCENSASTGGALLAARGTHRLSEDTFILTSSGERPTVLSLFLQGDAAVAPLSYGDGLRCIGGTLKRLYAKVASGGIVSAPQAGEISVSARSAALGAPIPTGSTRWYQVSYRDTSATFCPDPPGKTWNVSNGVEASWGP